MNEQMMALAAIAKSCLLQFPEAASTALQFVVERKVLAAIAGGVT